MVTSTEIDVIVIGAGVSGLTTGVCLAEAGLTVRVLAKDPPDKTTSAVAGASWGPYMVHDPRVLHWSNETRAVLEQIAAVDEAYGVRLVPGLEAAPYMMDPPTWAREVQGFRTCDAGELPAGYVSGWRYTIPLVDMPSYLAYLEQRLIRAGGSITLRRVDSFAEVAADARAIVNCAGLGARELVPDPAVVPVRGQLVVVDNPGRVVDWFFQDNPEGDEMTYFLPHGDRVVLGGITKEGIEHTIPDLEVAAAIVERCAAIEPLLRDAKILEHRVGLRPTRPLVRVERADVDGIPIMHNYGHGGSGLTLSWGCAREILAQVMAL